MYAARKKLRRLYTQKNELVSISNEVVLERSEESWLLTILKLIPNRLTLQNKHRLQLQLLELTNYYRFVRHFCGYPSHGQRTWSNACGARRLNKYVRAWYTERHFKKFEFNCPPSMMGKIIYAEFLNEMWYHQWHHEWVYAKNYRLKNTRLFRFKKWKFGTTYSLKNRALTYYQNPYKLKRMKGKKKITLPKNRFNVGFVPNFSLLYYKKLFSPSLWGENKSLVL
jgi:ribosomal protein S13